MSDGSDFVYKDFLYFRFTNTNEKSVLGSERGRDGVEFKDTSGFRPSSMDSLGKVDENHFPIPGTILLLERNFDQRSESFENFRPPS